jgi:hypothetical protein
MATDDLATMHGRLRHARRGAKRKVPEAAKAARINVNTWKAYESGRNKFGEDEAKRIGRALGKTNWLWLLHGLGEMKGAPGDALDEFDPSVALVDIGRAGLVAIREVDLYAGAGGGGHAPEAYRQLADGSWTPSDSIKAQALFPHAWLALLGLDAGFTDLVRVRGDSMSPEIEDGDWVFVDRRAHRLVADDIYLLWDGFGVVTKSLAVVRASHPTRVRILSANPKYPPDEVPIEEIMIIGRVQFRIGRIVRQ